MLEAVNFFTNVLEGVAALIAISLFIWQLLTRKKLNTDPAIVGVADGGNKKNLILNVSFS
jgi:hypothetical protein